MAVVYAKFSARTGQGGGITKGDAWDPDDPMVTRHPDWFTDDPSEFVHRSTPMVVEQATAAPGEMRQVKLPKPSRNAS